MYDWRGILSPVANGVEFKALATELRPRTPAAISSGCQKAFKALRDVKGHFLFCNHLTGNPAAVKTAMTGIDYHGGRRASTLSRAAPRCSRGSAARHSCNR